MKPGCRGPGRIEGPMVLDDPFGQAAKVRDGRSRQGVLPRRGSGLRSKRLAFRWSALGGRILIPGKVLPSDMGRIEADLLIPGRGDPIPNGCIVFDGPAITYGGPVEGAPEEAAGTKVDRVPAVLPGLWGRRGHTVGLRAACHYVQLCDGVGECLRGVRNQLRVGARVIKVCASGGVMSETDHPIHQQFSEDERRAIVGEAGRAERIVAAHCHGKPGIMAALRAGCGTIEHGSYLDEESVDLLIEKKAILVPTRYILERLVTFGPKMNFPDYAYRKVVELVDHHKRSLQLAIRKGVRIALGTDIWSSGEGTIAPWGQNARELIHLVEAGMNPLQAIEAATANAPMTLGPQAPRSGQLKQGYDADILAVRKDPRTDVSVLSSSENILAIWKSGQPVDRGPI